MMNKEYTVLVRIATQDELPEVLDNNTLYLIGVFDNEWLCMYTCPCGCNQRVHLTALGNTPTWKFTVRGNKLSIHPSETIYQKTLKVNII